MTNPYAHLQRGELYRQRAVRNARAALADLTDEERHTLLVETLTAIPMLDVAKVMNDMFHADLARIRAKNGVAK